MNRYRQRSSSLRSARVWLFHFASLFAATLPVLAPAESVPPAPAPLASPSADLARLDWLRREIARHDDLYFRQNAPEITDAEYDALKAELRQLEAAHPDAPNTTATPPPAPLGDDRTGHFATHRHREPMLSLAKAYTDADVTAFHATAARVLGRDDPVYRIEPKYDGIAISLTYEHGQLTRAATRGNGTEGDDITANVLTISSLPQTLRTTAAPPALIEIRGEIFLTFAEFDRLNAQRTEAGEPPFAHPRNLAAGTAKLADTALAGTRRLSVVCYGWGAFEPASAAPDTLTGFHDQLHAWGLPTAHAPRVVTGLPSLLAALDDFHRSRDRLAFPTDGAVVKLEAVADQLALGLAPDAPRWALARKFPAERAATRLLGITLQVGRTGAITPVAEFAPVSLSGSTISRATLHNADEIARRDLRVGDTVFIEKAGEIIPAIAGVDLDQRPADSAPFRFPATCPACDAPIARPAARAAYQCFNYTCPARLARRIEHFVSPAALDIAGLGPATVAALVERDVIRQPADLFTLRRDDLLALPGVGPRTADNLLAAIDRARHPAWPRLVHAIGLPGIGAERANALAAAIPDLDSLTRATPQALAAAGLSPDHAAALHAHLTRSEIAAELAALASCFSPADAPPAPTSGAFAGEVIVLTGTLDRWTRAEATAALQAAGARVDPGLTRRTTLVVAGANPGSTATKARERNIPVLDEPALLLRLNDESAHPDR